MNKILESTLPVAENARNVFIRDEGINKFVQNFKQEKVIHSSAISLFPQDDMDDEQKLNFILVSSSLAFCFWGEPKWSAEYAGKKEDGWWGLLLAFRRAAAESCHIWDAEFLCDMEKETFDKIFRGTATIPLADQRLAILQDVGKKLLERYNGHFSALIESCNYNALEITQRIADEFYSFNDYAQYKGNNVYFYKKAQLVTDFVSSVFRGNKSWKLSGMSELTAHAEYKIPQILRAIGILDYSQGLASEVDSKKRIVAGSEDEVEIRACTIWAVERIKKALEEKSVTIDSIDLSQHLWLMAQDKSLLDKPYHRTLTMAY